MEEGRVPVRKQEEMLSCCTTVGMRDNMEVRLPLNGFPPIRMDKRPVFDRSVRVVI